MVECSRDGFSPSVAVWYVVTCNFLIFTVAVWYVVTCNFLIFTVSYAVFLLVDPLTVEFSSGSECGHLVQL